MDINGVDEVSQMLSEWQNIISQKMPEQVMVNSNRLASPKTQMNERGSIRDRLSQTDKGAEIMKQVEDIRLGRSSHVSDHSDDVDDAIVDKIVDDIISKTILRGM